MRRTTHTAVVIIVAALAFARPQRALSQTSPRRISRHPAGGPVQERTGVLRRTGRLPRRSDVVPGRPARRALPRHVLDLLSGRSRPGEHQSPGRSIRERSVDAISIPETPPGQSRQKGPTHDRRQGSHRASSATWPATGTRPGPIPTRPEVLPDPAATGPGNSPNREACCAWRPTPGSCPSIPGIVTQVDLPRRQGRAPLPETGQARRPARAIEEARPRTAS